MSPGSFRSVYPPLPPRWPASAALQEGLGHLARALNSKAYTAKGTPIEILLVPLIAPSKDPLEASLFGTLFCTLLGILLTRHLEALLGLRAASP